MTHDGYGGGGGGDGDNDGGGRDIAAVSAATNDGYDGSRS